MYRTDSELIQACLDGNESAWYELIDRYKRLIYSIPLRQGLSMADADDVFQNVFTIVFRRLETLRNQKLLAAWLIRITYNECQHLRKRMPATGEIPETLADPQLPAQEEVEVLERHHLVHQAMEQLDPRCRELLTALFLSSPAQSYEQIAGRLGIPTGSIGPTRARCFKKLQAILDEMGVDLT